MVKLALVTLAVVGVSAVASDAARSTAPGRNGLIAYQSLSGGHIQLFTVRPDGSGTRQITHFDDSDAVEPVWSPDGSRIAFKRITGNAERIYTVNADGTHARAFERRVRLAVAWFPDGRHLLSIRSLKWVVVDARTGAATPAGIPGLGGSPCVLPDGKSVAVVVSRRGGLEQAIFIARQGGAPGSSRRITPWQRLGDRIDCSPDGTRILFSDAGVGGARDVFSVRVDGSGLRRLTHGSGNGADSWSPDGTMVAFASTRRGSFQIFVMNADGTRVRQVTHGSAAHYASWGSHP
jgi:TolB protein